MGAIGNIDIQIDLEDLLTVRPKTVFTYDSYFKESVSKTWVYKKQHKVASFCCSDLCYSKKKELHRVDSLGLGVKKIVARSVYFCPDCGYALFSSRYYYPITIKDL